jgi:hypothetical protein
MRFISPGAVSILDTMLFVAGVLIPASGGWWTGGPAIIVILLALPVGFFASIFMLSYCQDNVGRLVLGAFGLFLLSIFAVVSWHDGWSCANTVRGAFVLLNGSAALFTALCTPYDLGVKARQDNSANAPI